MRSFPVLLLVFLTLTQFSGRSAFKLPLKIPLRRTTGLSLPVGEHGILDQLRIKASMKTSKTTVKLENVFNSYYMGTITGGWPPQKMNVEFDTGSSAFWVMTPAICANNPSGCEKHNTYNRSKSTTYQEDGRTFFFNYVKGFVGGVLAKDDFQVAGLTVRNQLFGEASRVDSDLLECELDGIVGLSFSPENSPNLTDVDSLFISMVKQNLLERPVFAFYVTRFGSNISSELTLGGVNSERYKEPFIFAPIVDRKHWIIKMDSVIINGLEIGRNYRTLIDSGSTIIAGPHNLINRINKIIGGEPDEDNIYFVDCNNASSLPDITFVIQNTPFVMRGEDYVVEFEDTPNSTYCITGFYGIDEHVLIMGTPWMRTFYTLFDSGLKRLGFARAT